MQPADQRRDRSRVSERHEGWEKGNGYARQASVENDRVQRHDDRVMLCDTRVWSDQHFKAYNYGKEIRHDVGSNKGTAAGDNAHEYGSKVTFYFANIPDFMPLFRLRQFFEVCGILSDVYVARKLNSRGQVYGK
jgi:hypothetical protein